MASEVKLTTLADALRGELIQAGDRRYDDARRIWNGHVAGAVLYPFEETRQVLTRFRDFAHQAPDPLTMYPCFIRLDDGTPVLCLAACYAGPVADGERAVLPLKRMGRPVR